VVRAQKHRDIARFLHDKGWRIGRTKGSHEIWIHPDESGHITVPRHSEVTAGVVRRLLARFPDARDHWR
jgi:predicted RNA binding protein YcfA (HicA-like mRNA interferase family)